MAQIQNFTWEQGADLTIRFNYKEGATAETATIVNLTTGYAVRMDIVVPSTGQIVYTFNSENIADVDPILAGSQPDSTLEAVLSDGAGGTGNVVISVPRLLTLPGGAVYTKMTDTTPITVFDYDLFLRNTGTGKQARILKGSVTVETSRTLWL